MKMTNEKQIDEILVKILYIFADTPFTKKAFGLR